MNEKSSIFQDSTILTRDNLALVTDLTSGFSKRQAEELGFDVVGFSVNINYGGVEMDYRAGNEDNDAFYASMA